MAFFIHFKNTYFTPKNAFLSSPAGRQIQDPIKASNLDLHEASNKTLLLTSKLNSNLNSKKNSFDDKLLIKNEIKISESSLKSFNVTKTDNSFLNTYKKYALLDFLKGKSTEYILDLKEMPKEFLSLGFTLDQGSLLEPKVLVKYTDGSSESLALPYQEMFKDDWVKLETNPKLNIDSLVVTAASPISNSVFSFFMQQHL